MKNCTKKIKYKWNNFIFNIKNIPHAIYSTILCIKYPFLKYYSGRNKFFQKYNWLDSMPKGWKKAFGLQMCKEIRAGLLGTGGKKLLKDYQISDIKEKFGTLRWYDWGAPSVVHKIIEKYGYISERTCIVCGDIATVKTTGWICPYCDKHIPENANYYHFGHKDYTSWYGWQGNMDNIPNDIWEKEEKELAERP